MAVPRQMRWARSASLVPNITAPSSNEQKPTQSMSDLARLAGALWMQNECPCPRSGPSHPLLYVMQPANSAPEPPVCDTNPLARSWVMALTTLLRAPEILHSIPDRGTSAGCEPDVVVVRVVSVW